MWAAGAKEDSLEFLRQFSTNLSRDLQQQDPNAATQRSNVSRQKLAELSKLLARCYFKQGEWQVSLSDNWGSVRSEWWHYSLR